MHIYTHLNVDFPDVLEVCLVACQGNDYTGAGLTLQLLHPVLCPHKCVLEREEGERERERGWEGVRGWRRNRK